VQSLNLALTAAALPDLLNPEPLPADPRQRLLRFSVNDQNSVLLPLEQISEVLQVTLTDILPVPEQPATVLGICNWRGEMLWLVDFCQFVGYASVQQTGQQTPLTSILVMVVPIQHQAIGIAVSAIEDIELHDLQQLQPVFPGMVSPELLPLVSGLLPGSNDAVLNIHAIADYPLWKRNQTNSA
jgi:positive phototaxis protein PixI